MATVFRAVNPDSLKLNPGWSATGLVNEHKTDSIDEICDAPMESELEILSGKVSFVFNGTALSLRGVTSSKDVLTHATVDGQPTTIYRAGQRWLFCDDIPLFENLGTGPHTLVLNMPTEDDFLWVSAALVSPVGNIQTGGTTSGGPSGTAGSQTTTKSQSTTSSQSSGDIPLGLSTNPSLSTTSTGLAPNNPSGPVSDATSAGGHHVVAAAIGGALAGVLAVVICGLCFLRFRRRRQALDDMARIPRGFDVNDVEAAQQPGPASATAVLAASGPISEKLRQQQHQQYHYLRTTSLHEARQSGDGNSPIVMSPDTARTRDAAIGELHDAMEAAGFTMETLLDQLRVRDSEAARSPVTPTSRSYGIPSKRSGATTTTATTRPGTGNTVSGSGTRPTSTSVYSIADDHEVEKLPEYHDDRDERDDGRTTVLDARTVFSV